MNYVNDLRLLVGHRPLIILGATLLVLNQQNQLLMIKRTDNDCWGVPGGSMELGETIEETLKREIKEEIGLKVKKWDFFGLYSGRELYYQYPNGDQVYIVSAVYQTQIDDEKISLNLEEHNEHHFFDLHSLPEKISPPIKPILRDLQKRCRK